jgi:hypothetical protein
MDENELGPDAREMLANLRDDARAVVPLRVRDADRSRALRYVRALLFHPPKCWAHYPLAARLVPDAPVPREPFPEARTEVILATGPDALTNEELAQLLLAHRPMDRLGLLVATRAPSWSDAEFMALGAALAEERGWTAPAGW